MKRPVLLLFVLAIACKRDPSGALKELPKTPRGLPEHVDPPDNASTLAKVNLGRALFFDTRMSSTDFMACADCHREDHGWAGHESKSVNAMGKRTRRKALAVINAAYPAVYAWDGRAETLEDVIAIGWSQLGMTDQEAIARKLDAVPEYHGMFVSAFGGPATGLRIRQALGAYLRVLKDGDAPYDRFVAGESSAINESAKRGLALFNNLGCAGCHVPPMFSDWKFHNAGVGGPDDLGRYERTKVEADRGRFRTPSLRGVMRTGPWFHDGSAATLDQALAVMTSATTDPLFKPRALTADEVNDLKAFLATLTGTQSLEAPKVLPGGRPRT